MDFWKLQDAVLVNQRELIFQVFWNCKMVFCGSTKNCDRFTQMQRWYFAEAEKTKYKFWKIPRCCFAEADKIENEFWEIPRWRFAETEKIKSDLMLIYGFTLQFIVKLFFLSNYNLVNKHFFQDTILVWLIFLGRFSLFCFLLKTSYCFLFPQKLLNFLFYLTSKSLYLVLTKNHIKYNSLRTLKV